jgi:hypothetical protein
MILWQSLSQKDAIPRAHSTLNNKIDSGATLTSPCSVFQQTHINLRPGQHDITHHTSTNEHALYRGQVGVLVEVQDFNIVQLDVQILIDRLEDSTDADVILKLDGDRLVGKGLEETAKDKVSVLIGVNRGAQWSSTVPEEKHDGGVGRGGGRW